MKEFKDDLNKEKEIIAKLKALEEKKKLLEEKEMASKTKKVLPNKKNNNIKKLDVKLLIIPIILILLTGTNILYQVIYNNNDFFNIIYSFIFFIIAILIVMIIKKYRHIYLYGLSFLVIILISLLFLKNNSFIKSGLPSFIGNHFKDSLKWCLDNKIKCDINYDYSEVYQENLVIYQSIKEGTKLNTFDKITLGVSNGPNPKKEITLINFTGKVIDEAIKKIKELKLSNVELDFIYSNDYSKDLIISQNISGNIIRNDYLKLVISLGNEGSLKETKMIKLDNLSFLEAMLFLKRNGLVMKVLYDFSDTISKNHIISQSIEENKTLKPGDEVTITVSKGRKISIVDFTKMNEQEIINFITENNLRLKFIKTYDIKIPRGNVIDANFKLGDFVSEGELITIKLSLGTLLLPHFNSLEEFKKWASDNNVKYIEEYEFNEQVNKDGIIRFNLKQGDFVNIDDNLIVYISSGKAKIIPNFIGLNKDIALKKCRDIGVKCTLKNAHSHKPINSVIGQNKRPGLEVSEGIYIQLIISEGPKPITPPKPTCDHSQGGIPNLNFPFGSSYNQTITLIKSYNPKHKFNFIKVSSCANGSHGQGDVCQESIPNKWISYCDLINIKVVGN